MNSVRQRDYSGCGVACLAMLTDRTYEDARDLAETVVGSGRDWAAQGITRYQLDDILLADGWILSSWPSSDPGPKWPPDPWRERHYGFTAMHFVAIEADGRVLDTHRGGRHNTTLADWPDLDVVVGLSR